MCVGPRLVGFGGRGECEIKRALAMGEVNAKADLLLLRVVVGADLAFVKLGNQPHNIQA